MQIRHPNEHQIRTVCIKSRTRQQGWYDQLTFLAVPSSLFVLCDWQSLGQFFRQFSFSTSRRVCGRSLAMCRSLHPVEFWGHRMAVFSIGLFRAVVRKMFRTFRFHTFSHIHIQLVMLNLPYPVSETTRDLRQYKAFSRPRTIFGEVSDV